MFKFEINQKVLIKPLNKEGVVVEQFYRAYTSEFHKSIQSKVQYQVSYIKDPSEDQTYSQPTKHIRVEESELDVLYKISDVNYDYSNAYSNNIGVVFNDDMFDALRYSMWGLRGVYPYADSVYPTVAIYAKDSPRDVASKVEAAIGPRCEHVWLHYEGFTEKYDYCEKCPEKRK